MSDEDENAQELAIDRNRPNNDDQSMLNAILRITWAPSNFNAIVNPVQTPPLENDHFIEVQHFTAILIHVLQDLHQFTNWFSRPIGLFIDLATFVNEHRNLFEISRELNQRKKYIRFEDYHSNHDIQQYLGFQVLGGHGQLITVKQSVEAMLVDMIRRESLPFGRYTSRVGAEAKRILRW